jgi:hypothetical protein
MATTRFSLPKPDLEAHRNSLMLPMPEIIKALVAVVGKKLAAYIAGVKDTRALARWMEGAQSYNEAERHLRFAYHVVMTLSTVDSPSVVQAWLMGVNPELGDRVPIRMLRDKNLEKVAPLVLGAARTFAAGG